MKKRPLKGFFVFALTVTVCSALCLVISSPLIFEHKEDIPADEPYLSAEYYKGKISLLFILKDAPVNFNIEFSPSRETCKVTCFPKALVKKSTTELNSNADANDICEFLDLDIDRNILCELSALSEITDEAGGIIADTPYGLPSPSGNGNILAINERIRIYGNALRQIIATEATPSKDQMTYYSELIALLCQNFLKTADSQKYLFLKERTETDITYVDYYNNSDAIIKSVKNIKFSSLSGTWINEKYYLQ